MYNFYQLVSYNIFFKINYLINKKEIFLFNYNVANASNFKAEEINKTPYIFGM